MKIGLLFLILLGCISSCIKKVDYKKELYNAQVLMEHNPDSSFSITSVPLKSGRVIN